MDHIGSLNNEDVERHDLRKHVKKSKKAPAVSTQSQQLIINPAGEDGTI